MKVHDVLTQETIPQQPTSPRLYLGNLSFDTNEEDLGKVFRKCGKVVAVEVARHRQTQRSKGFGFLEMATTAQAKRAVSKMHGLEFMGRKLVVSGAKAAD